MTTVVFPASVVALLERTRDALADTTRERKSLPVWLPNGEEITTIPQLAAVLCIDEKTAAYCVLDAHNPPVDLVTKAHAVITHQTNRRAVRIIKHNADSQDHPH